MHTPSPPEWAPTDLARALKDLKRLGYTAADLAERAGVSRSQVSRWSSGAHRPGYDALKRLAGTLLAEQGQTGRALAAELCAASGYPGIIADLESTPEDTPPADVEEMVSPYSGQVWRIVRSLEERAEDAGLTEEEERAMIERAMENAERQAEMMFDAELRRRDQRPTPDADT